MLAQLSNILDGVGVSSSRRSIALGARICVSLEDDTCGSLAVFSDLARSEDVAFLSSRL